jgi:hypothetical protein
MLQREGASTVALPVNFTELADFANKTGDLVENFAEDRQVPGWLTKILVPLAATLAILVGIVPVIVVTIVVKLGTFFATNILGTILRTRTENAADFNQVIAAAMSEFLGVEISGDDLPTGKGETGITERVRAIGDKLHDLLTREFGGLDEITPERGALNARAFSGFGINFAVSTAFISILSEIESVGLLQNFRELGSETAQALGLGRLQRLALQPLIRNMIQQPYDLYLKGKLRPDRLSESQYVKAYQQGKLDKGDLQQALAEKGYPDNLIDILIEDVTGKIAAGLVARLVRYNLMNEADAIKELVADGLSEDRAGKVLAATFAERGDSQVSGILTDLETARLEGFLDQGSFSSLVDELPLADEEDRLYRKKVADQLERPRKKLTFAQVKSGIVGGILDFDYLDSFLQNEGYSDDDQLYLTYEILLAQQKEQTKEQIAAAKAARATARPPKI